MSATKARRVHGRRLVGAAVSGALVVAGLAPMASAHAAASAATTVLTLTSKTTTGVPATVAPGYHTFVLKESAAQLKKDPRGVTVLQLAKGYTTKTFDADARTAFSASKWTAAVRKAWTRVTKNVTSVGGLELESDFTVTGNSFTVLLKPGTYVIDNAASSDGAPDSYVTMNVSGTAVGAKPKSVGTITSKEFASKLVGVKAGKRVYTLHDAGAQIHMYLLFRLDKGHTLGELEAALGTDGPPPAWVHGGGFAGVLTGGQTMYTSFNFSSRSDYALVCFMPDLKTGAPHVALGMVRYFKVK